MKYIKYLLLSIPFFLLSISNVSAYEIDRTDFIVPGYARFWNCTGNRTCSAYGSTTLSKEPYTYYFSGNKFNTVANSYGAGISIHTNDGFVKGNYYTISFLVGSSSSASFVSSSHNNCDVSTSNSLNTLMSNCVSAETSNIVNDNYVYVNVDGIHELLNDSTSALITHTFVAPQSGSYLFTTFTTSSTVTNYLNFYGYKITSHGAKAPSTTDIKNALNSSFNSINNNINNVENSINNNINNVNDNINDMKESIDNSINSDDSDVNSSKCGIVCKLKNIAVGIIDLPVKIWEKLKDGFDLIKNAIGDFCNTIIGIFLPEPECHTIPPNLFNVNDIMKATSGILVDDDGFVTINYDNTSGTSTKYFDFFINKNMSLKTNTTYTLIAEVEEVFGTGGIYFISHFNNNNNSQFSSENYSQFSKLESNKIYKYTNVTLDNYDNSTNIFRTIGIFNKGQSGSIKFRLSLFEGEDVSNIDFEYKSYSTEPEEVCTKTSFFGWFEKFGQIIKGFFDTLLGGILDGLKSLFVPTDEQLLDIIDKSKELSENFGFVGQSINFFLNIFTSLLGLVNANGCVQLPEMTIGATSLTESHTFWESQLVCLNDNAILSNNIDTIRTITSIALVCLFVNFASRKFFEVLSKNEAPEQTQNIGGMYR